MLLDRERVIGAAFHGRVVRDDHAARAADRADPADDAGCGQRLVVDAVAGQPADLEPRGLRIEELRDTLAREQLAALAMPRAGALRAALLDLFAQAPQVRRKRSVVRRVALEVLRGRIGLAPKRGHRPASAVASNSSRPISMRRISFVPAPISY